MIPCIHHLFYPCTIVLVGQSNMVGHGIISDADGATGRQKNATLEWLVDNAPDQFGMLKKQKASPSLKRWRGSKAGKSQKESDWTARSDVIIACNNRELDDVKPAVASHGHLQAGKCAGDPGQFQMGPELGFGWTVGDAFNEGGDDRILLLKIAWGGKSLAVDFRPPSSGGATGTTTRASTRRGHPIGRFTKHPSPGPAGSVRAAAAAPATAAGTGPSRNPHALAARSVASAVTRVAASVSFRRSSRASSSSRRSRTSRPIACSRDPHQCGASCSPRRGRFAGRRLPSTSAGSGTFPLPTPGLA